MYRIIMILLAGCALLAMGSCGGGGKKSTGASRSSTDSTISAQPLAAIANVSGKFTGLTPTESGIEFTNLITDQKFSRQEIHIQSGMGVADIDADSDLDVYLCAANGANKLYRNEGGFKFSDVTEAAGNGLDCATDVTSAALFSDLNGDSKLDLYVCNKLSANKLFLGDGKGSFALSPDAGGLGSELATVSAAIFDADNDGDLDVYLANYRHENVAYEVLMMGRMRSQSFPGELRSVASTQFNMRPTVLEEEFKKDYYIADSGRVKQIPHRDQFYLNDGSGKFTENTREAGLEYNGWSFQPQACDFNNDGWTDLMVTSDFETHDKYYINNGDGTFTDKAEEMLRQQAFFSMGADTGDINGDGLPDMFVGDMLARGYKRAKMQSGDMFEFRHELMFHRPQPQMRNMLYLNRGEGWMSEMSQYSGVQASEWTWACRIADLNIDGLPELFVTNGMLRDSFNQDMQREYGQLIMNGASNDEISRFVMETPDYFTENMIFTGEKPLDYKPAEGNWGMTEPAMGCGTTLADFDGDGDRDILVNNTNKPLAVWRNDMADGNRAVIDLRMPGTKNVEAVGSRVWAHCGDHVFTDDVIISRGFATGESSRIYMGLGQNAKIDRLVIRWPDNTVQEYSDLASNQHFTISKASKLPSWEQPKVEALFAASKFDWEQGDKDLGEAEFDKEPLLPVRQSSLGTGAGMADVNGDGLLDIYFAGAKDQAGQLFLGAAGGKFTKSDMLSSLSVAEQEEMSVLWFDCDGDADQDLLLTSGGTESPKGSMVFQPRLLINGGGTFSEGTMPARRESTGHAAAADIDNDGDLDLLLAGHLVPNSFSSIAPSQFLKNEGSGSFVDATAQFAPGFKPGGQITEAQFADIDGDGWQDLVCSTFWGSIEHYRNENGVFKKAADLTPKGWWRSLGIGDYDNDGDLDIIAGNLGWNAKYHPKEGMPTTMFAADFDDNGTRDLIEVKQSDTGMLPGRGRSCSGYAIGYIPQKWPTWESFADATLEEVYGHKLNTAERFDADVMRHVSLMNKGDGSFDMQNLPEMAQMAPVFGIAVGDYNNDGNLDAFLANNYNWPQCEAGIWQQGFGTVMLGDGKGTFSTLEPPQSGSWMHSDMRSAIPADFNADGMLDVIVSGSAAAPQMLLSRKEGAAQSGGSGMSVSLVGKAPNTAAVGARLMLSLDNGAVLTRLVQAGNGYLGSYSGPVHFGIPSGAAAQRLTVIWPDGTTQDVEQFEGQSVTVTQ